MRTPQPYDADVCWAVKATHGQPHPFIYASVTGRRREDVQRQWGKLFFRDGDITWRDGWRRAYREGWRAIRVQLVPFGATPQPEGKE